MKSFKSVFVKASVMMALTSVSNSFTVIHAQPHSKFVVVNETAGNIRFVHMEGDMLVFELHLKNLLPKGSTLRITDGENNVIFEERTNTETYSIRYKIVRNNMEKINFEISNKDFFLNQSFNVNTHLEEKVEVTKA